VGGLEHTSSRRVLALAAAALVLILVSASSGAASGPSKASLEAQDAALAAKSRAAVLGLYSLDQRLADAQARLTTLHVQLGTLAAERRTLTTETAIARRDTRIAQQHLAGRLRQLYEQGTVGPLEILLGARSLDEALASLSSLKSIANQDTAVLNEVTSARARFQTMSSELAARAASLAAAQSAEAQTTAGLAQAQAARSGYISSLAAQRRLTEGQIAALEARARAAQIRSAALTHAPVDTTTFVSTNGPPPILSPSPYPPQPIGGGTQLTVVATGYSLQGTTATGLPVGWGVAAVDPSVIPLGEHMIVPGYGNAVAADTGGAIVGDTIDLWFPTIAMADAWGRRLVTITVY